MVATIARTIAEDIGYVDAPEAAAIDLMARLTMRPELFTALLETMTDLRVNRFARLAETVPSITGSAGRTYSDWCVANVGSFVPIRPSQR